MNPLFRCVPLQGKVIANPVVWGEAIYQRLLCRPKGGVLVMTDVRKIILIIFLLPLFVFANGIQEKIESILKEEFGDSVEISFVKYQIPPQVKSEIEIASKQKFFSESIFIWLVKELDSLVGIGLMDNVYGKAQPITFITIFNLNGKILSNHIVKYREEHGGQVANRDWNKQFVGMDKNSKVNNQIDGISGATISVNSIKRGVKKLLLLFEIVIEEEL